MNSPLCWAFSNFIELGNVFVFESRGERKCFAQSYRTLDQLAQVAAFPSQDELTIE
jgi:hypothetical protein